MLIAIHRSLLLLLTLVLPQFALSQSGASLTVRVTGLRSDRGQVMLSLHNQDQGFPGGKPAVRQQVLGISRGVASVTLADLPPGRYALAVIHDENGNGKMDTNWMGLPKEGWGASRDPRPTMRGPRFDESAFELKGPTQEVSFSIKY